MSFVHRLFAGVVIAAGASSASAALVTDISGGGTIAVNGDTVHAV